MRREVTGWTLYGSKEGPIDTAHMQNLLREIVPTMIGTDPDGYRTTREIVYTLERLCLFVAVGQRRNGSVWWLVLAIGSDLAPPAEYYECSHFAGTSTVKIAIDEGDFDE